MADELLNKDIIEILGLEKVSQQEAELADGTIRLKFVPLVDRHLDYKEFKGFKGFFSDLIFNPYNPLNLENQGSDNLLSSLNFQYSFNQF